MMNLHDSPFLNFILFLIFGSIMALSDMIKDVFHRDIDKEYLCVDFVLKGRYMI